MARLKTIKEVIDETGEYIKKRMDGTISSCKTGFPKMDRYMIDGIEWNSTLTIGGRPSVGKSAVSDCIVHGCFKNNVDEQGFPTFDVLDFNWELSARVQMIRNLSSSLKKSYKHIISADNNTLTEQEYKDVMNVLIKHYGRLPMTFCEEPLTVKDFGDTVRRYVDKTKRNTLVRVDHTLLARNSTESNQVQLLQNLLMEANAIKKDYPVIFMFLTQVSRELEERQQDNTDAAYPRQGDVYGGDAAAMFSETIILLNKPSKYGINYYGKRPGGVPVDPKDLFFHIVKNRNSDSDIILRYKEYFEHMTIKEL